MTRTARFWVWENDGWIRLSLRTGQTLRWAQATATDEGWRRWGFEATFDGDTVVLEEWSLERDCDGRLDSCSIVECPFGLLQAGGRSDFCVGIGQPLRPEWRKVRNRQRDYTAEAAGY